MFFVVCFLLFVFCCIYCIVCAIFILSYFLRVLLSLCCYYSLLNKVTRSTNETFWSICSCSNLPPPPPPPPYCSTVLHVIVVYVVSLLVVLSRWVTLWSGSPQCSQVPQAVRKFSPPLKAIPFPTRYYCMGSVAGCAIIRVSCVPAQLQCHCSLL